MNKMAFLRWLFRKPGEWLQGGGRNVPFVGKYYPTIAQAEQDFLRQQAASQQAAARLAQQQAALQQVGGQAAQTQRELQALLKQLEASSTARQRLLGLEPQLDQARHEIQKVMQDYATLRQLGARVYPPGTLPRPVAAATDVAQFNLLRRRLVGAGADPLYNAPALKALSEVWPRKITTAQELQKFEEFLRKATGSTVAVPGQGGTPLRLSTEQAAKLQQTQKALQEAKAQQENLMRVDPQLVKQLKMLPQETRNAALALQAAKERAATRHLVGGALGGTSIVGGAALSRARTSPGVGKGRGADDSVNSTAVAPAIATTPLPTGSTTGGTSDDKGKTNNNWMSSPAFLIPASALALGGLGYGLYSSYRRNANDEDEDEKMASSRDVIDRLALASVLVKQADDAAEEEPPVRRGGPVSRFIGSTVGQLGGFFPNRFLSARAFIDPDEALHSEAYERLAKVRPEELRNVVLRLGGSDAVDDLFWKKDRNLPWYRRLGGRHFHNPRTTAVGKVLGLPVTAASQLSPFFRASHYNPFTDVASSQFDSPAVTEHELGHAIDFNRADRDGPAKSWLGRLGRATRRDLYMLARGLTPVELWQEGKANTESHEALREALKGQPEELRKRELERTAVLPGGIGSYVAGVPGLLAGRTFGVLSTLGDNPEVFQKKSMAIDRLALASVLVKQANIPQMGVQQYMPLGPRRELSPEEEARLRKGKSRWFPRVFESYNMDPTEAMADPLRSAVLSAAIPTLAGAGIGGLLAGKHNHEFSPVGAAVGGLGLGGLSGLLSYWQQQAQNESMEDLIRRHPPGASWRDIISDPVFREDRMMDRVEAANAARDARYGYY